MNELYNVKLLPTKDKKLIYVNNPKVACSSIKFSFLGDNKLIHLDSNYVSLADTQGAKFFSVVRSPYERVLSAYLNTVVVETNIWMSTLALFTKLGGVGGTGAFRKVEFEEFLTIINFISSREPHMVNPHYRTQFYNLRNDVINYDFVGRLEDMSKVSEYLSSFGIILASYAPHKTNAKERLTDFSNDYTNTLIEKTYALDFETFGYAK
jgi:hypothetical protein